MEDQTSPGERIAAALLAWPGVERAPHRFGGVEYRLGKRELGHLHGDTLVDLPFPRKVRDELVAAGRAHPHHLLPDSGWVSFWIESPEDVEARSRSSASRTTVRSRHAPGPMRHERRG